MASLSAQMDVIVEKTKNLIQLCEALQEENDLLKLEVQSLHVAFQTSTDKVQQLEEKVKALAVAKSLDQSAVDKEAINEKILDTKQKINDLDIVEKTKNLIQLCEALQEENDLLKLEVQSLHVAFQTSTDKVQQLEEKVKALAVAKSLDQSAVDKEAINEKILDTKQKINDFVREIDRCIGLLK